VASSNRSHNSVREFQSGVAANWPHRRPVRRAIRWDALFPIDLPGPAELAELAEEIGRARAGRERPFDLLVEAPPSADTGSVEECLARPGCSPALTPQPQEHEIREVIDAGP
jgi:hypothetical protein